LKLYDITIYTILAKQWYPNNTYDFYEVPGTLHNQSPKDFTQPKSYGLYKIKYKVLETTFVYKYFINVTINNVKYPVDFKHNLKQ